MWIRTNGARAMNSCSLLFVRMALIFVICFPAKEAFAAQTLRQKVDQRGDFLLIGNTLAHDCMAGTPTPIVGTVGNCGANTNETAPDVFWQADAPAAGQAQANTMITLAQARSTAVLNIPAGAMVTHAYLYWGANLMGGDDTATLDRPGGFTQDLTAIQTYTSPTYNAYQSVADITSIVQMQGSGAYRVSGVNGANLVHANNEYNFLAWWMVVFYELPTDPPRNLALFDGLDFVNATTPVDNLQLTGILVPAVVTGAKLGVVSFDGDNSIAGDSFSFGPTMNPMMLSDALNPATNFFNGTHSFLGAAASTVGDLPQLSGAAQSMSGIDIDVIDVTSKLTAGQTTAYVSATSTQDNFYLAGFVTSIPTFKPDLSTSEKSAVDVNGGALVPGDIVEYTIVAKNTGNDTSVNTVLTDPLPMGVTYVAASISISAGANMGMKTDMPMDDQCEYIAGSRTVVCRLGTMANGTAGGQLLVNESSTVKFRVTIDSTATGTILNQATITAGGLLGTPAEGTPTDGNGVTNMGKPPTPIVIEQCDSSAQCKAPTPACNTAATPNVCVECLTNMQCPQGKPVCDTMTNGCICIPTGNEICDGKDNNCDGMIDDGCVDSDMDGLPDDIEIMYGTNPMDADSDDDGVLDGQEPSWNVDSDGDGKINVLDPDSDNDGLFDGTELGLGCSNAGTDPSKSTCKADADPSTTTNPLNQDTDSGGIADGSEDANGNGKIDPGEGDPNNPVDDTTLVDTDMDGLTDIFENEIGSNPMDSDTDDDGVPDGDEPNPAADSDGDGLINVLDSDSDNDGLFDGTEMGYDCKDPGTDTTQNSCIPDADRDAPGTSPIDADSDHGGVSDGSEDVNRDGKIDPSEANPLDPTDDPVHTDTDMDGLSDKFEMQIGSNPMDADSDDDGVIDGQEANPAEDSDGDGKINVQDPDSDNDGLFDGTEMGQNCMNPATNPAAGTCIVDADPSTTTSPLDPDTDHGGVPDGAEDANKNGRVDSGETNPREPSDDRFTVICGNALITADETCDDGNTADGDGCDSNCTPTSCGNGIVTTGEPCDDGNTTAGDGCSPSCQIEMPPGPNSGSNSGSITEPDGCACSVPGQTHRNLPLWMALPLLLCMRRRRRYLPTVHVR